MRPTLNAPTASLNPSPPTHFLFCLCSLVDSIIYFGTVGSIACLWGPDPVNLCRATRDNGAMGNALIAINVTWAILLLLLPNVMWSLGACCHHSVGKACDKHGQLFSEGGQCGECSGLAAVDINTTPPTPKADSEFPCKGVYYPNFCFFCTLEFEAAEFRLRAGCGECGVPRLAPLAQGPPKGPKMQGCAIM